jgi:hypothetical protein
MAFTVASVTKVATRPATKSLNPALSAHGRGEQVNVSEHRSLPCSLHLPLPARGGAASHAPRVPQFTSPPQNASLYGQNDWPLDPGGPTHRSLGSWSRVEQAGLMGPLPVAQRRQEYRESSPPPPRSKTVKGGRGGSAHVRSAARSLRRLDPAPSAPAPARPGPAAPRWAPQVSAGRRPCPAAALAPAPFRPRAQPAAPPRPDPRRAPRPAPAPSSCLLLLQKKSPFWFTAFAPPRLALPGQAEAHVRTLPQVTGGWRPASRCASWPPSPGRIGAERPPCRRRRPFPRRLLPGEAPSRPGARDSGPGRRRFLPPRPARP